MARLVTSGFEIYVTQAPTTGDTNALKEVAAPDGYAVNSATRSTDTPRSGVGYLRCSQNQSVRWTVSGALDRGYWFRAYIRVNTGASGNFIPIMSYSTSNVYIDSSGRLFCSQAQSTYSVSIDDGNWHRVEFYVKCSATQANRAWELRVDGTTVSSGTGQTTEASAITYIIAGITSTDTTLVLNYDDVALNDATGTSQTSWPGDGYVICLNASSVAAAGSWTGGAGGSLSAGAVANTPPIGTASETDSTQIEASAVATTAQFYTETYLAAGAAAGDTAVLAQVVVNHGEDVSTGTKSGHADTVIGNNTPYPLGTGTFNFGSDLGALGTWPQYWRWSASAPADYTSQPTLGTQAVVGITTTTSSRVASCDFIGLMVEMRKAAQFEQLHYQFEHDDDTLDNATTIAGVDTAAGNIAIGSTFRLRSRFQIRAGISRNFQPIYQVRVNGGAWVNSDARITLYGTSWINDTGAGESCTEKLSGGYGTDYGAKGYDSTALPSAVSMSADGYGEFIVNFQLTASASPSDVIEFRLYNYVDSSPFDFYDTSSASLTAISGSTPKSDSDTNGTTTESASVARASSTTDVNSTTIEGIAGRTLSNADVNSTTSEAQSVQQFKTSTDNNSTTTEIESYKYGLSSTDVNSTTTDNASPRATPTQTEASGATTENQNMVAALTSPDTNSTTTENQVTQQYKSSTDNNSTVTEAESRAAAISNSDTNSTTSENISLRQTATDNNSATTEVESVDQGAQFKNDSDTNSTTTENAVPTVPVSSSDTNGTLTEAFALALSTFDVNSVSTENSVLVFLASQTDTNSTTTEIISLALRGTDAGGSAVANTGLDNFNRTDGAMGANWTTWFRGGSSPPAIVSNRIQGNTANESGALWAANAFSGDQFSQAEVQGAMATANWTAVHVRCDSAGSNNYTLIYFNNGGTYELRLYKKVSDAYTQIGSTYTIGASPLNTGDVLKIQAEGTTISAYVNGTQRISVVDGTFSSGSPGVTFWRNEFLDNWQGGDIALVSGESASVLVGGESKSDSDSNATATESASVPTFSCTVTEVSSVTTENGTLTAAMTQTESSGATTENQVANAPVLSTDVNSTVTEAISLRLTGASDTSSVTTEEIAGRTLSNADTNSGVTENGTTGLFLSSSDTNSTTTEAIAGRTISNADANSTVTEAGSARFLPSVTENNSTTTEAQSYEVEITSTDNNSTTTETQIKGFSTSDVNGVVTEEITSFRMVVTEVNGTAVENGSTTGVFSVSSSDTNSTTTETGALSVGLSATESSGTTTEGQSRVAVFIVIEAGTGADSETVKNVSTSADNGTGTETAQLQAVLTSSDTNSTTTENRALGITTGDQGFSSENYIVGPIYPLVFDTGLGTETVDVHREGQGFPGDEKLLIGASYEIPVLMAAGEENSGLVGTGNVGGSDY